MNVVKCKQDHGHFMPSQVIGANASVRKIVWTGIQTTFRYCSIIFSFVFAENDKPFLFAVAFNKSKAVHGKSDNLVIHETMLHGQEFENICKLSRQD